MIHHGKVSAIEVYFLALISPPKNQGQIFHMLLIYNYQELDNIGVLFQISVN